MDEAPLFSCRRWWLFACGLICSLAPAFLLTHAFAQPGRYLPTLLAFWVEFLVGPVKYWLPVLLGHPAKYGLHPMPGTSTWVYAVCLPLTLTHPIRPCLLTAWLTVSGFVVGYGWAFLILAAFEF